MAWKDGWEEWTDSLRTIQNDTGSNIEKPFYVVLWILKTINIVELLKLWVGRREQWPTWITDVYVVGVTIVLFLVLLITGYVPRLSFWIASYFLVTVLVYLLNVLFLTKIFGPVVSYERTLILFMFNAAQFVLIFAIFYRLELPSLEAIDALVKSLLVFGTVGVDEQVKGLAGFQVAIDFVLLTVFLGHFVGRLGGQEKRQEKAQ
jgi:hypothetical protein